MGNSLRSTLKDRREEAPTYNDMLFLTFHCLPLDLYGLCPLISRLHSIGSRDLNVEKELRAFGTLCSPELLC